MTIKSLHRRFTAMSQYYKELHNSPGQAIHPLCKRYALIIYLNFYRAAYKTTISLHFPHGTISLSLNIPYLALEEGSPLIIQTDLYPFYLITYRLFYFHSH
jgi:hypothetical protein